MEKIEQHRILFKVGSSTITSDGQLNSGLIDSLATQTCTLMDQGYQVAIVTSGAVACGKARLSGINGGLVEKQIAATVGQRFLENVWGEAFNRHQKEMAYFTLSERDIPTHPEWPLLSALRLGIVPIVNANDGANRSELSQLAISADNDKLAGFIAGLINAGTLILLTDVDGVKDKQGLLIKFINRAMDVKRVGLEGKSELGTGGMQSKLSVATNFARNGRTSFIANGRVSDVLLKIVKREEIGTRIQILNETDQTEKLRSHDLKGWEWYKVYGKEFGEELGI